MQSCDACTKSTEPKYRNCPPIMSDGRHFTDYRPRCDINFVGPKDKTLNSYDYRMYLTQNGERILGEVRREQYERNMCGPCMEPYQVGTMLPEQSVQECDTNTCRFTVGNPDGLGLGRLQRTYKDPQVAQQEERFALFKENEQRALSKYAPCCTTAADDANLYALDGRQRAVSKSYGRPAVPGGGVPYQ